MKNEDILIDMLDRIGEEIEDGATSPYFIHYDEVDAIKKLINYNTHKQLLEKENSLVKFIEERCVFTSGYNVSLVEFKQRYTLYCKYKNLEPVRLNKQSINSYITHIIGEGLHKSYGKYMIPNIAFKTLATVEMEEYLHELIKEKYRR